MISNSGHDENGKYSGGRAGDQTGKEWAIIGWYNRPWKCVIRHPDAEVREKIASLSEKAAKNDNIGYDQGQRVSYWNELAKAKYNPAAIKTKCEADCSSGVMANVKAAGYLLNNVPFSKTPKVINKFAKDIALYNLVSRKGVDESEREKTYLTRYNSAIAFLTKVAEGKIDIGVPEGNSTEDAAKNGFSMKSSRRTFTRDSMRGW